MGKWIKGTIGDYFKVQGGYAFKSDTYVDDGALLLRISNVGKGFFDYKDLVYLPSDYKDKYSEFLLQEDDVVMGMTGDLGKICKIPHIKEGILLNQRVGRFVQKGSFDENLLYYYITSSKIQSGLSIYFSGGAQANISPSQIESIKLFHPESLTEQKKIATILSTLDDAIEATQTLIDKHEAIKEGMMHDLFSRGIDPQTGELRPHPDQAPHLFKESELGLIPKEWEEDVVKNKIQIASGGTPSTTKKQYRGNEFLWITPDDLSDLNSITIKETKRYLTKAGLKGGATLIPQGSVVLSSRAPIGYCAIPQYDYTTNQGCKSFIKNNRFDSYRLYYYVKFIKNYFIKRSYGTTFLEISKSGIEEMLFSFPEIAEQEKIADTLRKKDTVLENLQQKKQKLLLQKQGLMHDLLSGKVRVE